MCAKLKKAMPVGSRWTAYHHHLKKELGVRTIASHRSRDFTLTTAEGRTGYLGPPLPKADHVIIDDAGRITILGNDSGQPLLTYTPA
jgi:hypothetical protein